MSDGGNIYGPANRPIFDPAPVRGQKRIYRTGGGAGGLAELPPFSFGGIIRNSFTASNLRTNVYPVANEIQVDEVVVTLTQLATGTGPTVRILKNGVVQFTSNPTNAGVMTYTGLAFGSFEAGSLIHCDISDDGSGDAVGLTVMMRL